MPAADATPAGPVPAIWGPAGDVWRRLAACIRPSEIGDARCAVKLDAPGLVARTWDEARPGPGQAHSVGEGEALRDLLPRRWTQARVDAEFHESFGAVLCMPGRRHFGCTLLQARRPSRRPRGPLPTRRWRRACCRGRCPSGASGLRASEHVRQSGGLRLRRRGRVIHAVYGAIAEPGKVGMQWPRLLAHGALTLR